MSHRPFMFMSHYMMIMSDTNNTQVTLVFTYHCHLSWSVKTKFSSPLKLQKLGTKVFVQSSQQVFLNEPKQGALVSIQWTIALSLDIERWTFIEHSLAKNLSKSVDSNQKVIGETLWFTWFDCAKYWPFSVFSSRISNWHSTRKSSNNSIFKFISHKPIQNFLTANKIS